MKRRDSARWAFALVLLAAALCLAACGAGDGLAGDWTLKEISAGGVTVSAGDLQNMGAGAEAADISFTFRKDGTVKASIAGEQKEGTYELEGTEVTVTTEDGLSQRMTYDAGARTLTISDAGTAYVLGPGTGEGLALPLAPLP